MRQLRISDSQGGACVHNLVCGLVQINSSLDSRKTPFHKAHSTEVVALHDNPSGDESYYNNVCVGHSGLSPYDTAVLPVRMSGNVFLNGAKPCKHETAPLIKPGLDPALRFVEANDGFYLEMIADKDWSAQQKRALVTTKLLGMAAISGARFENRDGSPLCINTDYFGKKRSSTHPCPCPFELSKDGTQTLRVWSASMPRQ